MHSREWQRPAALSAAGCCRHVATQCHVVMTIRRLSDEALHVMRALRSWRRPMRVPVCSAHPADSVATRRPTTSTQHQVTSIALSVTTIIKADSFAYQLPQNGNSIHQMFLTLNHQNQQTTTTFTLSAKKNTVWRQQSVLTVPNINTSTGLHTYHRRVCTSFCSCPPRNLH